MLIVFLAQLVGGILGFVYQEQLRDFVEDGFLMTLDFYDEEATVTFNTNVTITEAWDFVHERVCFNREEPHNKGHFGTSHFCAL